MVTFQYLQLEVFRNRQLSQTFKYKYSCGMSHTGYFPLGLFLCLYTENRFYSKGVWLRIIFPNLFVLFASDAVLVVVCLSFLFGEMIPLLIFLMLLPEVDR